MRKKSLFVIQTEQPETQTDCGYEFRQNAIVLYPQPGTGEPASPVLCQSLTIHPVADRKRPGL